MFNFPISIMTDEIFGIEYKTLKALLVRECEKEGVDHRNYLVKIRDRKTRRIMGRCWVNMIRFDSKNFDRPINVIELWTNNINSLGQLLKVFNHELLHSRGIKHKDMLNELDYFEP